MVAADTNGRVNAANTLRIGVGTEWAGAQVTVIRTADHATVIHTQTGEIMRELTIDPDRKYHGTGKPRGGPLRPKRLPNV